MLAEDTGAGLAGSPRPWQHGAGISFLIMKRQVLCLRPYLDPKSF
jgi:hypothetical protein